MPEPLTPGRVDPTRRDDLNDESKYQCKKVLAADPLGLSHAHRRCGWDSGRLTFFPMPTLGRGLTDPCCLGPLSMTRLTPCLPSAPTPPPHCMLAVGLGSDALHIAANHRDTREHANARASLPEAEEALR